MMENFDKLEELKYLLKGALGDKSKELGCNRVYGQTRDILYVTYYGELDRKYLLNVYKVLFRFLDSNKNEFEMYLEDNLDNLESGERGFRVRIQEK